MASSTDRADGAIPHTRQSAAAFARSTALSRSFPASPAAVINSDRASSMRPSRASSSPRTLGSRCDPQRALGREPVDTRSALAGPVAIETATARFSSITGLGAIRQRAS